MTRFPVDRLRYFHAHRFEWRTQLRVRYEGEMWKDLYVDYVPTLRTQLQAEEHMRKFIRENGIKPPAAHAPAIPESVLQGVKVTRGWLTV